MTIVALLLLAGFTRQYPARVFEQRSEEIVAAWEFDAREARRAA